MLKDLRLDTNMYNNGQTIFVSIHDTVTLDEAHPQPVPAVLQLHCRRIAGSGERRAFRARPLPSSPNPVLSKMIVKRIGPERFLPAISKRPALRIQMQIIAETDFVIFDPPQ